MNSNISLNRGFLELLFAQDPQAPLLPGMPQECGYATAHYGKWHLVVEQDDKTVRVCSSDPKSKPATVARDEIEEISPSQISQMPQGLLNQMSTDELQNLVAYIMSGGNKRHKVNRGRGRKK